MTGAAEETDRAKGDRHWPDRDDDVQSVHDPPGHDLRPAAVVPAALVRANGLTQYLHVLNGRLTALNL